MRINTGSFLLFPISDLYLNAMAKVLFFGELKDISGHAELELTAGDLNALMNCLYEKWPDLKSKTILKAINQTVVEENSVLHAADEVALMPPFSGG